MNSALSAPNGWQQGWRRPPAAPLFLAIAQEVAGWCLCTNALAVPVMRQTVGTVLSGVAAGFGHFTSLEE